MIGSRHKSTNPAELLQHAEWHCKFGSESAERTATQDDLDAAEILNRLRHQLEWADVWL